jgi:hypothetical protein
VGAVLVLCFVLWVISSSWDKGIAGKYSLGIGVVGAELNEFC